MSKKAIMALVMVIVIPVICYYIVKAASSDAIDMPKRYYAEEVVEKVVKGKKVSDTIWHQVDSFALVNQLGDTVSITDLRGKIVVIDFFFTHCPSICPYLTHNMKYLQDALKNDITKRVKTDFVHFVSFSVDPQRDSVEQLKKYADRYGVNHDIWWMLTGPKKTIYDFALQEVKLPLVDGGTVDSNFIHTEKFVVLDKKGIVRGYYNGLDTTELSQLAKDITFLQLEKDKDQPSALFEKLKGLWPIYIAVIIAVALFIFITRRPRNEPKPNT